VLETDLIARACETNAHYLALGNRCFQEHEALFIRNDTTPARWDSNTIGLVRTDGMEAVKALLRRAEEEYAVVRHIRFDTDPLTPPQTIARLALEGYRCRDEGLVLVLEGELLASPKPFTIREALTDSDWQSYQALNELDLDEWEATHGRVPDRDDANKTHQWLLYKRNKAPAARTWLAYVGERPVSFLTSWAGYNGVGIVEDLFTHPDYRHRGLATALLAHCVADTHTRGAGPVIINADPDDTPKQMYAAMGFQPLYVSRSYFREL
jgi:GNAT superfamily N-acetyltransferase